MFFSRKSTPRAVKLARSPSGAPQPKSASRMLRSFPVRNAGHRVATAALGGENRRGLEGVGCRTTICQVPLHGRVHL